MAVTVALLGQHHAIRINVGDVRVHKRRAALLKCRVKSLHAKGFRKIIPGVVDKKRALSQFEHPIDVTNQTQVFRVAIESDAVGPVIARSHVLHQPK